MNCKLLLFLSLYFITFRVIPVFAQIPPLSTEYWYLQPMHQTTVAITAAQAAQGDMVSDGSGHHYVAPNSSGSITHYLFDNTGTLLSSSTLGSTSSSRPSITARNGLLHVTLHNASSNRVELYESNNGGLSWGSGFILPRDVQGTMDALDAYEDQRGVHIVYSSSTGIFYYMRDLFNVSWANYNDSVYVGSLAWPGGDDIDRWYC